MGEKQEHTPSDATIDMFGDGPMLADLDTKIAQSYGIIEAMLSEHNPVAVYTMNSGGNDSLITAHLMSKHPCLTAAAHVNTSTGIIATRNFVGESCDDLGIPLIEKVTPWEVYRQSILKHGFPGPSAHMFMYRNLKERRVREFVREAKTSFGDRVALITGVRLSESVRRMGNVKPIDRQGAAVWTAPVLYWTEYDKELYILRHGLRTNPVSRNLGMSGECLCGAYASGDLERALIKNLYPDDFSKIEILEQEAKAAGVNCRWGTAPPDQKKVDPAQMSLNLCAGCDMRRAA